MLRQSLGQQGQLKSDLDADKDSNDEAQEKDAAWKPNLHTGKHASDRVPANVPKAQKSARHVAAQGWRTGFAGSTVASTDLQCESRGRVVLLHVEHSCTHFVACADNDQCYDGAARRQESHRLNVKR